MGISEQTEDTKITRKTKISRLKRSEIDQNSRDQSVIKLSKLVTTTENMLKAKDLSKNCEENEDRRYP